MSKQEDFIQTQNGVWHLKGCPHAQDAVIVQSESGELKQFKAGQTRDEMCEGCLQTVAGSGLDID